MSEEHVENERLRGDGETLGPREHHRRRRSAGTLYALAESTYMAWERVKDKYSRDPVTRTANLNDVGQGYRRIDPLSSPWLLMPLTALLISFAAVQLYFSLDDLVRLVKQVEVSMVEFVVAGAFLVGVHVAYHFRRPIPVLLVDFVVHRTPEHLKMSHEFNIEACRKTGLQTEEAIEFQKKILAKSGIGQETCGAEAFFRAEEIAQAGGNLGVILNMHNARIEAETVIFTILDELFKRNNIQPKEIDILIVNCSLFNPTPSLSAMIVNKYKMRSNILTYNLSGMGCSAGLISVDLAKDLLQVHRNKSCVIVSTENITQNWYLGLEKSMLVQNALFRVGGAAILLSNRVKDRRKAQCELVTVVRTHVGADDLAYDSVFQMEDKRGFRGVKLSKNIMDIAGSALKKNVTTLATLVFPFDVHIKFGIYLFKKKILRISDLPPFVPDFHRAFDHFCIHTGGRAVLDVFEKALMLSEVDLAPSRNTLYNYGNVSSASVWYEMDYVFRSGRLRKGNKIWQIAFGSGFKCNSAVWRSLRTQKTNQLRNGI
uniref:3-ketoacyl-CoA synthase n=1 Tax=Compsopogon caeruleus TaxID=31354 RepID=A0A7S1XFZ8_9RHOD